MNRGVWDRGASDWFAQATYSGPAVAPQEVADRKRAAGLRVTVCLPALNEIATLPRICESVHRELMEDHQVVDELIVLDAGSDDGTPAGATAAGARVHNASEILPALALPADAGKGASLWKSLAVASGDVIVWIDADVENFAPHFVTNLLWPLLKKETVVLVKGFYERPLKLDGAARNEEGARVTEIAIRPLINLLYPALSGVIQPLSGECALLREAALDLRFAPHYGVEIGLLIDVADAYGISALAQVDLGIRIHRNRSTAALGRTAFQVMQTFLSRLEERGRIKPAESLNDVLVQFSPNETYPRPVASLYGGIDLPPMRSIL